MAKSVSLGLLRFRLRTVHIIIDTFSIHLHFAIHIRFHSLALSPPHTYTLSLSLSFFLYLSFFLSFFYFSPLPLFTELSVRSLPALLRGNGRIGNSCGQGREREREHWEGACHCRYTLLQLDELNRRLCEGPGLGVIADIDALTFG